VAIPKQGTKKALTDCHVGEKNEPTDLFMLLRALSDRYTATYDKIHSTITINRIFDTAEGPIISEVFLLEFSGCFTEFHLRMPNETVNSVLMVDEWCQFGPRPDFGLFPWSLYFIPHRAYTKNPDSAHPYNLVRRIFRGWLKDPQTARQVPALFREFLFPRLSAELNQQHLNLESRRALPEVLRDLTGGSVRVHWAKPSHKLLAHFGENEWLFSLTVVFPWAIDILQQGPNAVSTDSTFHALEPYTLPILHAIIANESLPLTFGVSPTETEVAYGKIYDHILDLCRVLAAQITLRELAPLVQVQQPRPPRARPCPPAPSQMPAEATECDECQDKEAEQETALEKAECEGDIEWPDDPNTISHLEEDLAGEPPEDTLVDDVPEVNHSPMPPPPVPPPRFTPALLMAFRLWDGTILTALPLLTDQGAALAAFVEKRGLIWKLCHRHIIEAIGANSLIGQWAARLLRCYSEAEWVRTREVIIREMADPDLSKHFPHEGAPYQSLLRLLQINLGPGDKHHLAQMDRWALWLRHGVPRVTNSAESVNGHINAKINPADDFVDRLIVVATHLRDRYLSRNTWCDRALKRNAGKCWPSTAPPRPFSADRAKFYQRLHNAETLTGPVKRRFPPPNPSYLIRPECTANWETCQLPAKFGVRRSSVVRHDAQVLSLTPDSAKTEMSYAAWQIVFWLRLHIGERKWRECNTQIFTGVVNLGTHLGVPKTGDISIDDEAKWRAQCWIHCADWTKGSQGDTPRSSANTTEGECPPPPSGSSLPPPSRSRRAPRQRKSGVGAAGARGTPLRAATHECHVVSDAWHPSPRLELRGLLNMSATCYINAVLQCLLHLSGLKANFPDYHPGDMDATSLSAWFATAEAGLALSYWKLQHCMDTQTRTNLYDALYAVYTPFRQGGHHDAHECLVQLVNGLEADLGPHKHIIDHLFSGTCETELCCTRCHAAWVSNPDPFRIISVPLQRTQQETGTLEECLSAYGVDEVMSRCPGCRRSALVACSKRDRFCFLPPVLVFHLKRFAHFSGPRSTNLEYHVPFPDTLDMSPYLTQAHGGLLYDLSSIVVHSGSLNQGHYVAYVRIDGTWHLFDDAYVAESDPATVQHQAAYLLFYERRGDPRSPG
jgi:ubiquitin carboxyl-terminal hydrolase 22/27/51